MTSHADEKQLRQQLLESSKRVVVKLGTAVLMREEGGIALSRFYSFVESIAALFGSGKETLLVSSGAVGLGVQRLGLEKRPTELPMIQACAAVGQGILMSMYSDAFGKLGIKTAQVLLCDEDFTNRRRYLNLRTTISELLRLGVIPIINENDTVSTSEIEANAPGSDRRTNFGDNDKLSALVASKIDADMLVILTDVDGLYSEDPRVNENAVLIDTVQDLAPYLAPESVTSKKQSQTEKSRKKGHSQGRGGIRAKLEAARVATQSGCACIIANGKTDHVLDRVFASSSVGTLFVPQRAMTGRSRWIAFATSVNGSIIVNDGAREALEKRKASLLAAGITEVRGNFARGDVVSILDEKGLEFARGLANYDSGETRLLSGKHSDEIDQLVKQRNYDAVITRDNIAFTS